MDRGFDCITPVVHEFTFQAMSYDLLDIKDDIYEFMTGYAEGKHRESIPLSDEDSLWRELRHEHIANVTRYHFQLFFSVILVYNINSFSFVLKRFAF